MSDKKPLNPNGNSSPNGGDGDKAKLVHSQVNEVVGIMQNNIEKVMERGEKMETLAAKTEDLQQTSAQFKKGASKVRKAMWWKNVKLQIAIAAVVIIILIIIIVPIVNNVRAVTGGAPSPSNN